MKKLYLLLLFAAICSQDKLSAATETIDFEGDDFAAAIAGWTNTNLAAESTLNHTDGGSTCATNGSKATASLVSTKVYKDVSQVVFYISKTTTNKTDSYFTVSVSPDGSTWTEIGSSPSFANVTQNAWTEVTITPETPVTGYIKIAYGTSGAKRVIDDITITYADAVLEAPIVTGVANGGIYYSAVELNIANSELATSYTWSLSLLEPGAESPRVVVAETSGNVTPTSYICSAQGVYTLSVSSTDGTNNVGSTITFTVGSNTVASVAEFLEKGAGETVPGYTEFEFTCPLAVLYRCGNYMQVCDHGLESTTPVLIYDNALPADYPAGSLINAGTKAKYQVYNGVVHEMYSVTLGELNEETTVDVAPFYTKTTEYINTPDRMSDFVAVKNVTFDVASRTITDDSGTAPYALYSGGPVNPTDLTIAYDVEGFTYFYNSANCIHLSKITPVEGAFGTPVPTISGSYTDNLGQIEYAEGSTLTCAIPYGAAYCTVSGVIGVDSDTHFTSAISLTLVPGTHSNITVTAYNDADEAKSSASIAGKTYVMPAAPGISIEPGIYLESQDVTATYVGAAEGVTVTLSYNDATASGDNTAAATLPKVDGEETIYTVAASATSADGTCSTYADARKVLISSYYFGSTTITLNVSEYATANGWANSTKYESVTIDGATFTASGSTNTGKYYSSDQSWRIYRTESGTITISLPSYCAINRVALTDANIGTLATATALDAEGLSQANGFFTPSTTKGQSHSWRPDVEALTNTITFGFDSSSSANAQLTNIEVEFFVAETSGITPADTTLDPADARYYNLQGIPVANPIPGQIYIRHQGTTATKIRF